MRGEFLRITRNLLYIFFRVIKNGMRCSKTHFLFGGCSYVEDDLDVVDIFYLYF